MKKPEMLKDLLPAMRITIALALFIGLIFPIIITLLAQFIFPHQANGSLIRNKEGVTIGSELIGQSFMQAKYFHPRPSAAGKGYNGESSGGTNLGPTSSKLINGLLNNGERNDATATSYSFLGIKQLAQIYATENLLAATEKPPVDAVTYSGSGLDPHISEANAILQARRIGKARNLPLEKILNLVQQNREDRQFGIFGEPRVNVLKLNIALEETSQ